MLSKKEKWDPRNGGLGGWEEEILYKNPCYFPNVFQAILLFRKGGQTSQKCKVYLISHFLIIAKLEDAMTCNTFAILSEMRGSKKPLKTKVRHNPLAHCRRHTGAPSFPSTKSETSGQDVRRVHWSRHGEESNLKTLFHNYGKFFTFMLYWK